MIQSLRIIKEEFEDEIEIQPTLVDNDRVIDLMMYLKADKKTDRHEYHHTFDLQEVEMIRDFLTSVLNTYKSKVIALQNEQKSNSIT